MNRREFIRTLVATTTLLAVGATGVFEFVQKASAGQSQQQLPSSTSAQATTSNSLTSVQSGSSSGTTGSQAPTAPPGYVLVAQLSSLAGKSSQYFAHPVEGSSILLSLGGQWKAFSAVCTHRPCTVRYQSAELYCPCHGATFSANDGSVTRGPAQTGLVEYGVLEQNGGLYVTDAVVN